MAAPLSDDVLDRVFRTARTFNSYTDRPVGDPTLRAIYDLLKWGPTSTNQCPLRIVWCKSPAAKARLAACCADGNAAKVLAAPASAILGMDMKFYEHIPFLFPHFPDARQWYAGKEDMIAESALRNSSLQGAYFIIAARLLGLDTNAMSGFDEEKINRLFFANTPVRVNFITTLGYGDAATLYPRAPRLAFEQVNTIL